MTFDGEPYLFCGKKVLACHLGPDKHHKDKKVEKDTKEVST